MTYNPQKLKLAKSIRFPQTYQIRPILGLNKGKLPRNLTPQYWEIDGLKFCLYPVFHLVPSRHRPHRLLVTCPCGKEVSAGRFNQHQSIHPRELLSKFSLKFLKTRRQVALEAIEILQAHDEGADMDAGFDAGEFSRPAHNRMAQKEIEALSFFSYDEIMDEINVIGNTEASYDKLAKGWIG